MFLQALRWLPELGPLSDSPAGAVQEQMAGSCRVNPITGTPGTAGTCGAFVCLLLT